MPNRMSNLFLFPFLTLGLVVCFSSSSLSGQSEQEKYKPYAIGFYNVENLFDTIDNPKIRDEEFLPDGDRVWNSAKYKEKVANIASIVSQMGTELCDEGLSILGISEIENDTVLYDIVDHPILKSRNYGVIHHDSKDVRGIDVALIYDKDDFIPLTTRAYEVDMSKSSDTTEYSRPTRPVFLISGELDGELIHMTVNHWPSRSGGEKRSARFRNRAAQVNRKILDSLLAVNPAAKLIVMGDLNDDPSDESLTKHLLAKEKINKLKPFDMFNPMAKLFKQGHGSNAYRDRWSLFDQIVVSQPLTEKDIKGLRFHKANIYKKGFMIQKTGEYKGYPKRTFSGDVYQSGFSDHFPVYIYLLKEV